MDDPELIRRFEAIEKKLDATFVSAEKTRKYIFWTVVITVGLFVVPLIASVFILPSFINTYAQIGGIQ